MKQTTKVSNILSTKQYEKIAKQRIDQKTFSYFCSGSDNQITLKNNSQAFNHIKLYPRVLRDISVIDIKTKVLGVDVDLPFGIAPFAMQKLIKDKDQKIQNSKGQKISAFEAGKRNTAYGLSLMTTTKLQDVKKINPNGLKVMQLYFLKQASYTQQVVRLAHKNGFSAVAITVDTQSFGKRRQDQRNLFSPNAQLQVFKELNIPLKFRNQQNKNESFIHSIETQISWQFINNIRKFIQKENLNIKIILKGIMDPRDVEMAFECKVDAIWISNHGGRQLDTSPATIWALPAIRQRVNHFRSFEYRQSNMQVFIDGGIWRGADIFKCLALGADFVFIGRAFLYSMIEKQEGISNCFDIFTNQLRTIMGLCGVRSIKEITKDALYMPQSKI